MINHIWLLQFLIPNSNIINHVFLLLCLLLIQSFVYLINSDIINHVFVLQFLSLIQSFVSLINSDIINHVFLLQFLLLIQSFVSLINSDIINHVWLLHHLLPIISRRPELPPKTSTLHLFHLHRHESHCPRHVSPFLLRVLCPGCRRVAVVIERPIARICRASVNHPHCHHSYFPHCDHHQNHHQCFPL